MGTVALRSMVATNSRQERTALRAAAYPRREPYYRM